MSSGVHAKVAADDAVAQLATALTMTRNLVEGDVTPEAAQALVTTRALLVQRARELCPDGWTEAEKVLVDQLVEADRQLVQRLWKPRRDAFRWMRERNEAATEAMPHLRQLDAS